MKLWTIQSENVYNQLMVDEVYYCDITKSQLAEEECFKTAYNWISQKMIKKIKCDNKNIKYPVWLWYKYDGKYRKPDLRQSGYGSKGSRMICMELEINDNHVMLSDFDNWHCVLNDYYAGNDYDWFYSLPVEQQQIAKEKSWNKIFNIREDCQFIQANIWEIKLGDVKKSWRFVCK